MAKTNTTYWTRAKIANLHQITTVNASECSGDINEQSFLLKNRIGITAYLDDSVYFLIHRHQSRFGCVYSKIT